MKPTKPIRRAGAVAALCFGTISPASSASLSLDAIQRVDTPATFAANLTTGGTRDWAYWASTSNPIGSLAPTNDKATGGTIISSLATVGGGSLRGTASGASTVGRYTWTDGTSPLTGTGVDLAGGLIFNNQLGSGAAGKGLSFTISGLAGQDNYAVLYLGGFGATGTLTLTMAGTTTVVDTSQVFGSVGPKPIVAYQVKFNPDNASDVLTVEYTASSITDTTNGHVGIDAVTVGLLPVIPEPAVALLGGLGILVLAAKRRR